MHNRSSFHCSTSGRGLTRKVSQIAPCITIRNRAAEQTGLPLEAEGAGLAWLAATYRKSNSTPTSLNARTVVLMSLACLAAVANLYYLQPLLPSLAHSFQVSEASMGGVVTLTQLGYAAGMAVFLPLSDRWERRRMLIALELLTAMALCSAAVSPSYRWLAASSLFAGAFTVIAQISIPLASQLSRPEERGSVVGKLYTGILLGVLLGRTFSGFTARYLGWRFVYWAAAAMALAAALGWWQGLPQTPGHSELSYSGLLRSIWELFRTQPAVRRSTLIGAMLFGSLNVFWTTLAFFVARAPYHYGPRGAGLFGLLGATSAFVAPLAGRMADRRGSRFVIAVMSGLSALAFGWLLLTGKNLWALMLGIIGLDVGVQGAQVANQSHILAQAPHAGGRVNTVYMVGYFGGGALGSGLGAWAWSRFGWSGVCSLGLLMLGVAVITQLSDPRPSRMDFRFEIAGRRER